MRSRVSGRTRRSPFSARDAVETETPAALAISRIVLTLSSPPVVEPVRSMYVNSQTDVSLSHSFCAPGKYSSRPAGPPSDHRQRLAPTGGRAAHTPLAARPLHARAGEIDGIGQRPDSLYRRPGAALAKPPVHLKPYV